jgi:hypothetical protein
MSSGTRQAYQYVVLRCVPRPEREEFLNVGVVLSFVDRVCRGDERAGEAARQSLGQRFGFLKAPRSTVLQPGPVHGGVTDDPARQLEHLRERLVG